MTKHRSQGKAIPDSGLSFKDSRQDKSYQDIALIAKDLDELFRKPFDFDTKQAKREQR